MELRGRTLLPGFIDSHSHPVLAGVELGKCPLHDVEPTVEWYVQTIRHYAEAHPDLEWPGKDVGLTERESQAVTLLAQGLSNREIASALYLSPETVKSYVGQIFAKLNVRNRVEATNFVNRTLDFSS